MPEDKADSFLRLIRRSQRGRLKVYLGYSAGVGKTYQMLQEGHRLKAEGIDVVIGLLETHGRADIARLAEGLDVVPRRRVEYRGIMVEEMDPEAVLARKPQVALIDELAHTNVPGGRNAKRYEDVQDILAAGIHVISTLNVQHLESLYNVVEKAVGVKVRERLPDSILAEADEIVDVDLATEDLRKRIQEGKVYPAERIPAALANFFTASNLEKLREMTLRELAAQIDLRRRGTEAEEPGPAAEQVMVCLSARGPNSERLLRYGSRLAGRLNRNWYAVYVQTPSEEATLIDARTQRLLSETLTLAKQLGALVFTYRGEDVAETLLSFAREYRVGQIIIGGPAPKPFWKKWGKNKNIVADLIKKAKGINIVVIDTREEPAAWVQAAEEIPESRPPLAPPLEVEAAAAETKMASLPLVPERIVVWDGPVERDEVLRNLVEAAVKGNPEVSFDSVYAAVIAREAQGSTFFNEGVAFPHVRVPGLKKPVVALGLTRAGVSDVATEKPVEIVFLILSPAETPAIQVRLLGLASRAAQSRYLLQCLDTCHGPDDAFAAVREWENSARNK